jgi:beta-lactamase regulating signal transducer with metallopeptidase domain
MDLFMSYSFSGEAIIRALSWTLLHSLWQGILLSFVAGAIMLLTKKAKPLLRYNLLATSLILFIVGVAVTFINQLKPTLIVESNLKQILPINRIEFSENLVVNTVQSSAIIQTINFINTNAIWIVSIWLLIIVIKFIRLSSGFYNIYQLKHRRVSSPSEYWNKRITELCQQLKINKKVALLQSGIVTIPSVIGYFKPVILFPAAMLTALPVHEVEAILIHELGHIRRNDFVVNMLQNIVEIVFFFNPAIMWVSSLIKTERENCCDEIAVTITGSKHDYIKALINFLQFEQQETQQFTTAFAGEKNHLLSRVKRIVYNNNKTLNTMEKKFLSASLILVSVCLFAFVSLKAQVNKKQANPNIQQPASNISVEKTKPEVVSGKRNTKPVYKSEVPQAKDKQAKPNADTVGKDAEQHNPKNENLYKFANRTGIHFGDDDLTAYYNGKEISRIDRKKSKEEIEDWLKKYAPLTGVDLNAVDKSYYIQPASPTQRIQRTASIQRTQQVAPTAPTAPIEPINSSVRNTNSSTEGITASGFTGIYIDKKLAIAYKNDKEISRITSKNSKAEIEKWRDDIEKLLNTKFPSIQQNLIDKKKE